MSIAAHVVVADDDADTRHLLRTLLEKRLPGIRITTAADGEEALQLVRGERIDVLVLDHEMPRRTGLEVASLLQGERGRPGIVFLTGDPDALQQAIKHRCVDRCIRKPPGLKQIVAAVAEELDATRRRRYVEAVSGRSPMHAR